MARNTATVTFTLDSNITRGEIVTALENAARTVGAGGNVRDITVTALDAVREVTVPAADYAAFEAWKRNTGRA